ncbi:MAG: hypothetical protein IPM12_15665 [Flavobacteriales bacterium]|nr:hypothetical protein [Flavobacteriales bacterium]
MRLLTITCFLLLGIKTYSQSDTADAEYDYGNWGVGAELGPCTGIFLLTGNAANMVQDGWCYANAGLTFSYRKVHYILQTGGISGSIISDLNYGENWNEGNGLGSTHLQLSVGYELLNTKRFTIIPFVSGGLKAFNSSSNSSEPKRESTNWIPSFSVGTAFDFKIHFPIKEKNQFPGHEYVTQYLYFRVLTGVYPAYFQNPLDIRGSMYFINLSIGGYHKPGKKK